MCGIAGYYGRSELSQGVIQKCLNLMNRRGPDANGVFNHKTKDGFHVTLLHSRLSILDIDPRSNQPFQGKKTTLSYNGEIYNFKEIRSSLEECGHTFNSQGDTEVLSTLLETKGLNGLSECEGMWAFALFNHENGQLVLSRDRFGEKPLYIHRCQNGDVFFASEIKFIISLLGQKLPINIRHLRRYLVNGYKSLYKTRETFFEGLEELFETAEKQYNNAKEAIISEDGNYLAKDLSSNQRNCMYDLSNFLRKHIAVPSKKRMLGDIYTVYGVAGSGNLGIGTLITPLFMAEAFDLDQEQTKQLVVLAFLTSVYVKQNMNVVTVLCGTGHATGASAAAVTSYLKSGTDDQVKDAINLYLSTSMGFVCDGAKLSCTYKVSFAAMNGVIAGKMVHDHERTCDGTGLNKMDVDKTIQNLGKLNNEILKYEQVCN